MIQSDNVGSVLSRLGGDHRLLVVDDDPASTEVLAAMLRQCGAGHFDPDIVAAFCDLDHAALLAPLERPQASPIRASSGANPAR